MKHLLTTLFVLLMSFAGVAAQGIVQEKDLCESPQDMPALHAVDSFKDTLTLTLDIQEVYVGEEIRKIDFQHTEKFTSESNIIRLDKDIALRVSVVRIVSDGNKFYLYKLHLYQKQNGCWHDRNNDGSWNTFQLGNFNSGYRIGTKGEDCLGYDGDIEVE